MITGRKMGIRERKKREKERRAQQIIVAAGRVFSRKGFNQAVINDIAREAELSIGAIYSYFKNKDELYVTLSLRILQYLNMRVEHVNLEAITPQAKLELLIEAMLDVYEYDTPLLFNSIQLQSNELLNNVSPELVARIVSLSRKIVQGVSRIFAEGTQKQVFKSIPAVVLADIFLSIFSGVVLWNVGRKIVQEQECRIEETLRVGFDIFRRGVLNG